jgi:hypothetical protein
VDGVLIAVVFLKIVPQQMVVKLERKMYLYPENTEVMNVQNQTRAKDYKVLLVLDNPFVQVTIQNITQLNGLV